MIPQAISITPPPSVPQFPKTIHWLWTTDGVNSPNFPKLGREHAVEQSSWKPQALTPFLDSIAKAKISRIILDPHFDERVGIWSIWESIQMNPDVPTKIIVGNEVLFRELSLWKTSLDAPLAKYAQNIEFKYSPLRFHDRFAVIDFELWHFGSTVGGLILCLVLSQEAGMDKNSGKSSIQYGIKNDGSKI